MQSPGLSRAGLREVPCTWLRRTVEVRCDVPKPLDREPLAVNFPLIANLLDVCRSVNHLRFFFECPEGSVVRKTWMLISRLPEETIPPEFVFIAMFNNEALYGKMA